MVAADVDVAGCDYKNTKYSITSVFGKSYHIVSLALKVLSSTRTNDMDKSNQTTEGRGFVDL